MAENEGNVTPWYNGNAEVDPEMVGHWQNKGLDAGDPAKIAVAMTKAHRAAEKLVGARADHDLVAVPKALDKGDWGAVWTRLGKPGKVEEYDFSTVKNPDGTDLNDKFVGAMRDAAFKANLPKGAASDVIAAVVKHMGEQSASDAAERTAIVDGQKADLARQWGTTPDQLAASPHMKAAQAAIRALGVDADAVNGLEKAVGYTAVMNLFRNIATKIGEDRWITGDGTGVGQDKLLTSEQAVARKRELMNDVVWAKKFLDGDHDARREMGGLDSIITNSKRKM